MNPAFKLISFDLDNCLYDNQPVLAAAETKAALYLEQAFAGQGQVFEFDEFKRIRESLMQDSSPQYENLNRMRIRALSLLCKPLDDSDKIVAEALRLFLTERSKGHVPAAMMALLHDLSQEFVLVSITNGNCDPETMPIAPYFKRHYSPLLELRAKPHPQMLHQAMEDFGVEPGQMLHVGDSAEKDGAAAVAAGTEFYQLAPFIMADSVEQKVLEFRHWIRGR